MDDALDAEVSGLVRSGHDSRADGNSPEPSGEDQPDVDRAPHGTLAGGVPDGMTEDDVGRRSELAGYLGRVWPATSEQVLAVAVENDAPDAVLSSLRHLPPGRSFENLQELWTAVGGEGHVESHRF